MTHPESATVHQSSGRLATALLPVDAPDDEAPSMQERGGPRNDGTPEREFNQATRRLPHTTPRGSVGYGHSTRLTAWAHIDGRRR